MDPQRTTGEAEDHAEAAWHILTEHAALARLRSDAQRGLEPGEASARLARHGRNEIVEGRRRDPVAMLLDQFRDTMIMVLLVAAVVSGVVGDVADTLVIAAIVVLNAAIGFVQEYRAERAVAALRAMAAVYARVVRGGSVLTIPAAELVPGDLVLLEAGNAVPADLRLIEAVQLKVEEATLTGESLPAEKHARVLHQRELPVADRLNMAWKGTLVTYGRARGLVVATGMQTELGRVARLLREEEEVKTPLQRRLARFGRVLSAAVLAICAVLFVVGLLRGEEPLLMALTAISLAVAAIPEALPAVVTVSLALGARRMVARNVLIRRLPAVETLGSVTYICADKTGTLTLNRMRVERVRAAGQTLVPAQEAPPGEPWRTLLAAMAVSNDARAGSEGEVIGDPTEVALHVAAAQAGVIKDALLEAMPRVAEIPFDSERARMTTLHRDGAKVVAFVKGAPERVIPLCEGCLAPDGLQPIDAEGVRSEAERMAAEGLRVLAFACRSLDRVPDEVAPERVEAGLTLLGLVGLLDPPRAEAADAVRLCRTAGITPVMITGDHPATARAIAQRLAMVERDHAVLTGAQLAHLSDEALVQRAEHVRVYARTSPEQKIRIVKALQARNEFVAMTGDGVNDAPALKRANIGVAMGVTGTDVAKEAAHMILLDDNFATIVGAVREGRRIFDNIRKFISYAMTGNSGEIWTLFLAPFLGLPIPLLPIHILWINLVTDGLPGLALALEPEERGIMRRPPRPPGESIFAHGMWQHILWVGLLMGGSCLLSQAAAMHFGWHWQSIVFTVLTFSQLGLALAIRSERESLFSLGLGGNLPLLYAVLGTVALHLAILYVPVANGWFRTSPLEWHELAFCFAMSAVVFVAVEIEKWAVRRGWLYAERAAA
jgi:Ca2+-transporting ATPase